MGTQAQTLSRVVVIHDTSPETGGASHLVNVLVRHLRQRGIPVTFLTGDSGAHYDGPAVDLHGAGEAILTEKPTLQALTTGFYNPRTRAMVAAWIRSHDTPGTVYHLHGWSKALTPSIFAALAPVKRRCLFHAHDYFLSCPNGGYYDYQSATECDLFPLSRACLARQCDKKSYAQKLWRSGREHVRRHLDRRGGLPARVIPLHPKMQERLTRGGWPPSLIHPIRNPVEPFSRERIAAERNGEIVFIGRISREKGADLAAAAAAKAEVPITFYGTGSDMDLVRRVNPTARLAGWADRSALAEGIAKARLLVMPSRWPEPFGLAALEAIGSGVPAVLSKSALMAEELEAAGMAKVIDPTDMDRFASLLSELQSNDDLVADLSHAGFQRHREFCTTEEQWVGQLLTQYELALGNEKSRRDGPQDPD